MCQALVTGLVTFISTTNPGGGYFHSQAKQKDGAGTDGSLGVPGLLATGCRFGAAWRQGLGFLSLTTPPLEKVRCRNSCNYYVWSHRLQPAMLLCPWDFPGQNTEVGNHSFLQGIFLTQGSNLGFLHYRWVLYQSEPPGKPNYANYDRNENVK